MGGEKKTAYADANMDATQKTALAGAVAGDVFKFAFNADGTVITAAKKYVDYAGYAYSSGTFANAVVTPSQNAPIYNVSGGALKFGPAVKYNSDSKRITLAQWATNHWDITGNTQANISVKTTGANVYVYDQNKIANKVYVADASDVNVDKDLVNTDYITADDKLKNEASVTPGDVNRVVTIKKNDGTTVLAADNYVEGLLDFVAAFEYDGDVIDIVIYKPYDFGVYYVNPVDTVVPSV